MAGTVTERARATRSAPDTYVRQGAVLVHLSAEVTSAETIGSDVSACTVAAALWWRIVASRVFLQSLGGSAFFNVYLHITHVKCRSLIINETHSGCSICLYKLNARGTCIYLMCFMIFTAAVKSPSSVRLAAENCSARRREMRWEMPSQWCVDTFSPLFCSFIMFYGIAICAQDSWTLKWLFSAPAGNI